MTQETNIKQQVREFYDQVGWQQVSEGVYQNARYEDLRPVSSEYIHKCHLRVNRHIKPSGRYLLDAGSGPIQYPEYLTYSEGYQKRVCIDISITALKEARRRIADQGLFVVADISKLPFKPEVFDSAVSLHTVHHLPIEDHIPAYREVYRVLSPGSPAVIVNGWHSPLFSRLLAFPIKMRKKMLAKNVPVNTPTRDVKKGTHVQKYNARWLKQQLGKDMPVKILVWRSINVNNMRFYIRPHWGGRIWLRLLYILEEMIPRFLGMYGAYPLVVIRKDWPKE